MGGCVTSKLAVEPDVIGMPSAPPTTRSNSETRPTTTPTATRQTVAKPNQTPPSTKSPQQQQAQQQQPTTPTPTTPISSSASQPVPPDPPGSTPSAKAKAAGVSAAASVTPSTSSPQSQGATTVTTASPASSQQTATSSQLQQQQQQQQRLVGRIRGKKGRNGSGNLNNGSHHNNSGIDTAGNSIHSASLLPTRPRGDSWAQGDANKALSVIATTSSMPMSIVTVEQQWQYLWQTQSPYLLDPADVPSCLGMLRSRLTNRLSSTEVTFVQRRVRTLLKQMATNASQQSASNKLVGRVFSATSATVKAEADTVQLAQQQHLLSAHILQKLWKNVPASPLVGPSSSSGNSTNGKSGGNNNNNNHPEVSILENVYVLLLYMSEALWSRVAGVARQTAQTANIDMDVNHHTAQTQQEQAEQQQQSVSSENGSTTTTTLPMPKPSVVPDLTEPPMLPPGVQLQNVVFLLALALRGSRTQRLQLLFYLCLPSAQLREFLDSHPAGGVPCWLLEVGQGQVVSLASLTHYHYFGTAFLPQQQPRKDNNETSEQEQQEQELEDKSDEGRAKMDPPAEGNNYNAAAITMNSPRFVRSKSRTPIAIPSNAVRALVERLLFQNSDESEADDTLSASNNNSTNKNSSRQPRSPSPGRRQGGGSASFMKRMSNQFSDQTSSSSNANNNIINNSGHGGTSFTLDDTSHSLAPDEEAVFPPSEVMRYLQNFEYLANTNSNMDADYDDVELAMSAAKINLNDASATGAPLPQLWTLEEFKLWADRELDDVALDACFYRLFGSGILPSFSMERDLVQAKWKEWQIMWYDRLTTENNDNNNGITNGVIANKDTMSEKPNRRMLSSVWGGLGGIDGCGGMGYGILYCVDRHWWKQWVAYSGFGTSGSKGRRNLLRPGDMSTERLLEKDFDVHIPGSSGSYELMKEPSSEPNVPPEYLLLPPGVWDVLYEMYGGGPPLPRMVLPPSTNVEVATELSKDTKNSNQIIDFKLNVAVRPWIIHCSLCDPLQPYKRGDAGSMTIRVMALPDQPLWRLFGEIVVRFSLQSYKAYDADGRGMGRLWKKVEPNPTGGNKEPGSRYGPWNLLCKNRSATLVPVPDEGELSLSLLEDLKSNWRAYTDNATVENSGLVDGDQVMFEFSVMNKLGKLMWPREAAAKAGRVRRLAEEDTEFRNLLQGVDKDGNIMIKPPKLVGLDVDAMDSTGRWYLVQILEVDIVDEDTDEENEDFDKYKASDVRARKKVKVEFKDHGHIEWIDVESDRLAKAGRFTNETEQQDSSSDVTKTSGGANNVKEIDSATASSPAKIIKGSVTVKKASSVDSNTNGENMRLCSFPGFGACGLTNLGNTCYVNSAVQCISYMPLLRSYLLSAQYKATGDLNKDNPLGTGGRLLEEFAELLRAMWSAKTGEKMPKVFRQKLGQINSQFSAGDQQDAQEFLNYVMDVLHEDSNKVRKKPYVEALEDDWVAKTDLPRVGDEAWRRFLRRNDSIMADVAMGQVLNTVTCPVCKYSSRNFDPFNLLSIPVPTVADVIFQCVVIRRATAVNTPWTLNKPRKGEKKTSRFSRSRHSKASGPTTGPPSDTFVAEQYVIAMSRLADSSDLRQRIQKACGIPVVRLRLCRAEVVVVNNEASEESVVRTQTKITPMTEKEGPCSHLARKKAANEDVAAPTLIIAFESTLRPRSLKSNGNSNNSQQELLEDTADEEEDAAGAETPTSDLLPSPKVEKLIRTYLEVYGDEKECRLVDSDPLALAKALSRSLWPRDEADLKLGLRVDAKDKRGNWFQGSVVEIVDHEVNGDEVEVEHDECGQFVTVRREVVVHFDNFAKKWDETYTIEHFDEGRVRPLYSHAIPKMKPTDFLVHHRYTNRENGQFALFGQPFYVQCYSEWSNARAGAQILAQASRFLQYNSDWSSPIDLDDPSSMDRENKASRLYEKTQAAISELIDLLVDCDREYIRLGLGLLSLNNNDGEKGQPFRNPGFDVTNVSVALVKKVNALLHRLPFELRVAGIEAAQNPNNETEEEIFPFSLVRTIGNFLNARQIIILHWRDHSSSERKLNNSFGSRDSIFYVPLPLEIEESGLETLRKSQKAGKERAKRTKPGSTGIDLGVCLTEFCKSQSLTLDDNWRCPRCKDFREGRQHMNLWRLPDLLTFHIKRFNMSARWREKITTKVNFPLTGLDLSEWCHNLSPVKREDSPDSHIYDLIAVMNHYGSMTGGHYVATCKATSCGKDGREEVAYNFNGLGTTMLETEGTDTATGWRLGGRAKAAETNQGKESASLASRAVAESAEPLWLQFDDELVDPIPPRQVVSEMAYVLFYRRRRITPSNIAKYSTLE
ncbi:hypothetical protein ACA910_000343 [Epithemia clementina (nom. ined.)]